MIRVQKLDYFSSNRRNATAMLSAHLTNKGGDRSDNFMSWSSSLLFVIQYAIYRQYHDRCPLTDVKVCVVDTTKFQPGQFARDIWLYRNRRATAEPGRETQLQSLMQPREIGFDDNGEYLSQGKVKLEGRSSTVSLQDLYEGGLGSLYPELCDAETRRQWTSLVLELRGAWNRSTYSTTVEEIDDALSVAGKFEGLSRFDIALVLLAMKNRDVGDPGVYGKDMTPSVP